MPGPDRSPIEIQVWSDLACPWCYVGKRRLEQALELVERPVEVRWRAFELDPSAPAVRPPVVYAERLAKKYGMSVERGQVMIDTMTSAAAEEGLDFHFEKIRPGNTFDAHRLVRFADGHDLAERMKERLFRAYLTEGETIGDHGVLARLAQEVGLEAAAVQALLASDELSKEVRGDEEEASQRGIQGVPLFLLADRVALSGAQPAGVIAHTLRQIP